LLIIARQIIITENGLLSFKSTGKQGGNLKIIYDSIQLSTKPVEMWAKNLANEIDKTFGRLAKAIPHWQQRGTDIKQRLTDFAQVVQQNGWAHLKPDDLKRSEILKQFYDNLQEAIKLTQIIKDRNQLIEEIIQAWEKTVLPIWADNYRGLETAHDQINFLLPTETLTYFMVWDKALLTTQLFQERLIAEIKPHLMPQTLSVTMKPPTQKWINIDKQRDYRTTTVKKGVAWKGAVWFQSESYTAKNAGTFILSRNLNETSKYAPAGALSEWIISWLEKLHSQMKTAQLFGDKKEIVRLFQKLKGNKFIRHFLPASGHRKRYNQIFAEIFTLKKELLPPVWRDWITVQPEGSLPRNLQRFVEKGALENRLAPTHALIRTQRFGRNKVLGMVQYDTAHPDRIMLHFDAKLTVDPWLKSLASQALANKGEAIAGQFTHWKLSAPKLEVEGVQDIDINVINNILQIKLTLDRELGNLVLWRLGSDTGLPMTMKYECRADPEIRGEIPLALSLAKRAQPSLHNTGNKALTIEYFMVDEQGIALNPALTVKPKQSIKLPVGQGKTAIIPAEAVYTEGVSLNDFHISGSGSLIREITLTNLLEYDDDFGGPLDYVKVTVSYIVEGTTVSTAGPFKLSSRGSYGSEIKIPFIKPKQGREQYRIEGRAYYGNEQINDELI
jgi:hypothetical protein